MFSEVRNSSKPTLRKNIGFSLPGMSEPVQIRPLDFRTSSQFGGGGNECTTESSSTVPPREAVDCIEMDVPFGTPIIQSLSSSSSIDDDSMEEESRIRKVICGEDLFRDLLEAAISSWIDRNSDEIMDRVVENYNLQPKKKKAKVSKPLSKK